MCGEYRNRAPGFQDCFPKEIASCLLLLEKEKKTKKRQLKKSVGASQTYTSDKARESIAIEIRYEVLLNDYII